MLAEHAGDNRRTRLARDRRGMRRQNDIVEREETWIDIRLVFENIERGTGDGFGLQGIQQRRLVDDRAPRTC